MSPPTTRLLVASLFLGLATSVVAAGPDAPCTIPKSESEEPVARSCGLAVVGAVKVSEIGGAGQLAVHGDLAAVVRRDEGIVTLVDLTDPSAPTLRGSYDGGTGQATLDHPLDGDVAFSHDGTLLFHARQTSDASNEGLHVLDVADPDAPTRTDLVLQGGMLRVATAVIGGVELVATQDAIAGLTMFEVVRSPIGAKVVPLHVDALPALKVGGPASAGLQFVDADGATPKLYATDGTTGLTVLDLGDPRRPVVAGTWAVEGLADLVVDNGGSATLLHAATEYWFGKSTPPELVTLDVTNPAAIAEVGRRNLGAFEGEVAWKVGGLHLAADTLLVAHGHAGLVELDPDTGTIVATTTDLGVPNPGAPYRFLGWYALDVIEWDAHVIVTDGVTGELRVLRRG